MQTHSKSVKSFTIVSTGSFDNFVSHLHCLVVQHHLRQGALRYFDFYSLSGPFLIAYGSDPQASGTAVAVAELDGMSSGGGRRLVSVAGR